MITRFLSKLSSWFIASTGPEPVQPAGSDFFPKSGDIARFSFNKRDFFATGVPKPRLFAPETHPESGVLETSVCGLFGVSDERLWFLGRTIRQEKVAEAAAILPIAATSTAGLRCDPDPQDGFPEHGVILGWSDDKDRRLSQSQDLVASVIAVKKLPSCGSSTGVIKQVK